MNTAKPANRHARRRSTKVSRVEYRTMTPKEFIALPSLCAWAGCGKSTTEPHKHGWSSMLLYRGEPKIDFMEIDPRLMARDCVVCPEHARHIDENLLINIGGRLREVAGAA